jgi:autotransporter-associated beta strand protein
VPLTLSGGTLQATASFSTSRDARLTGGINTFETVSGTSLTWNGNISGSGNLNKAGGGTLILAGFSSYTGGTTVSAGTLQGNSTSLQGNIVNNGAVVFNQASGGTYSGIMSGTGIMTLQSGGQLTMTGANTYTGNTFVSAGKLVVSGSLASTVAISQNATLGGNGTVGAVESVGAVAPGASIGTLTVSRGFRQNGGLHQIEVNGSGLSDRVNVGGSATLNGGTVQVLPEAGSYANSTTYTILNAAGGVTGTYSN